MSKPTSVAAQKGARHATKAAATKAKADQIGAEHEAADATIAKALAGASNVPTPVFLVTPKQGGGRRIHRDTCKRAQAHPEVSETTAPNLPESYVASCCKPVVLAAPAVTTVPAGADPVVAKLTKAIERATGPDRPKRASTKSPEYVKAIAAKAGGKRGPGKQVTDEQLDAYIRKANEARPTAFSNEQLEIAYWVDKLALSRTRWNAAWARVEGAQR